MIHTATIEWPGERFDLEASVVSGQVFRWERFGESWFGVDGDAWYQVEWTESQARVRSNVSQDRFERLFRLDQPYQAKLDRVVQIGPELEPFLRTYEGLRLMRPHDAVEEAISFLCTPNNHLKRIVPMVRRLAEFGGEFDEAPPIDVKRFPELETIAELDETVLRSSGFGYRAKTIPNAAAHMLKKGGRPWLESLRERPYPEAHSELTAIPGIGPKLADCIALFALHHVRAVPLDTHLWQALTRIYHPELKGVAITHRRYERVADAFRERFGDLTAYAHQCLFYDNMLNGRSYRVG